ncbi:MAG: glycosyltransferase family 2 protein [Bacteroidales bacterium]|nr:glycosyltransferase family 2 protein [Bacteroidales bacterium]
MPKVSVIVPIYNVAPYIERCVRSLMEQSLQDVQYIFVDDASPDGSIAILQSVFSGYPQRNTTLLTHSVNKGLPAARNTGLDAATGDFIYHCDSDDYLEPDALELMYNAAIKDQSDFVYCDFFLDFGTHRRYMVNPDYPSPEDTIKYGFLGGKMKYNVWNKLLSRALYEKSGQRFPEGNSMGEDMTIIRLATWATKMTHIRKALYHWMKDNEAAFSFNYSPKHLANLQHNTEQTISYLETQWHVNDKDRFLAYFKLGIKLPFLLSGSYAQYKLWQQWFPQANAYIRSNTILPWRTRLVQLFAKWQLWLPVKLYALCVNRLFYKQR